MLDDDVRKRFNNSLLVFFDSLINVFRSESKIISLRSVDKDLTEIFSGSQFNQVFTIIKIFEISKFD